eukprot:2621928-Prymnesium_polylepis.1
MCRAVSSVPVAGCGGRAALCIPYALSGENEFACSCAHVGEHHMGNEDFNERFYLMQDLSDAIASRRQQLQAELGRLAPPATNAEDGEDGDPARSAREGIEDQLAELDERVEELAGCVKHLDLYARHLLRKALSSMITIDLLEQLKGAPARVHLIVDYKQKVLPERHRATQTEAFGKRGKSLHGGTALRWDAAKGDFNVINVRVACDDGNQTWFHTLNALRVTLDEVVKTWPDVAESTLQSDGANNYDCTAFMASVPRLFEAAKVRLCRHVITEVGGGKNLQDTDFQQAQMALNHGLDGGRNFEDAQGILDTLEANKTLGVVNVGMDLGARALDPKKGEGPK